MKAFLLAAGEGRRLRPLTDSIPKCLVPIRGRPLLELWLELLERNGVTDVLVNVHHAHEQVTAFLKSYRSSMSIATVYEDRLLGSAGTVLANCSFVAGESSFLIVYADNLTNLKLRQMVTFHCQRRTPITIAVIRTDFPSGKGTVRLGRCGRVLQFAEKAELPLSNVANGGVYVASRALFRYLTPPLSRRREFDFGYDVFPQLAPNIAAYEVSDFLMDIGTPEAYDVAQRTWPGF